MSRDGIVVVLHFLLYENARLKQSAVAVRLSRSLLETNIELFFSARACPSSDLLRPAHSVGKLRPYVEFNAQTASDS
jgi:hypothetical protein